MQHTNEFEFIASEWLNTAEPLTLSSLRGKVVVVHAFQMLCPGCVTHGIPQAGVINDIFPRDKVQVIGMHSVFEHHDVMTVKALKVFLSEYRVNFPVVVDKPSPKKPVPQTMLAWQLQGTPSLIIFDQGGKLRLKHFGRLGDMQVGASIAGLVNEASQILADSPGATNLSIGGCTDLGCVI